ncbi:ABC transporter substrate-binding protein [Echinicola jeungdonensis]|uniref:ABC transporter substrate-binding protein n=1 Tax=Echinicola jeungdonensis TaxID=709343 RepID=A0ABV5J4F2_9BACT|nr:ABC transporter substrate-binding protein [Echinicola jeungdonensis]MDN3667913.1 ABC transporter substrate-binding protein [Echinicola jeungdonensis]
MKKIRIIGVPEHFNFPWIQTVEKQALKDKGFELVWRDESKGSGAMNKALRDGEADIAILLTESFIKDKLEGNPGKIIGYHVLSPLTWGIHVPAKAPVNSIEELQNAPFLISRFGSGSHLMAFLLAQKNNWSLKDLKFEIVGNMEGAQAAFQDQQAKAFLWEKFTTKPLVDQGLFKRVGEIPTPWPCFVMVAHENILKDYPEAIKALQDHLYSCSKELSQEPNLASMISQAYGIQEEDIQAWLKQTQWATNSQIEKSTLEKTMDILFDLDLITSKVKAENLVDSDFARLV